MIDKELRHQMVISKAKNTNYKITTKSWLIMGFTWFLWLYALYFLSEKHEILLNRPFAGNWMFKDILFAVQIVLGVQLVLLISWALLVKMGVRSVYNKYNHHDRKQ